MKNLLFLALIPFLLFMSSCSEENLAVKEQIVINDTFVNKNPALKEALTNALLNGEEYISETFTQEVDEATAGQLKIQAGGLAGAQIITGQLDDFQLVRPNYTLHGYNVVDDFISTSAIKDRFKFQVPSASERCIKLYTYNDSYDLHTTRYIIVGTGCTNFSFLTSQTNWGIGSVKTCAW